jgi:hypothetical protein
VGHTAPSVEARYLAAVRACGEGLLSGRGHRTDRAARQGDQNHARSTSKEGGHEVPRHPDHHHSRHAWEQDRHREREARARGDEFRRYTYNAVYENPDRMMAELREQLL